MKKLLSFLTLVLVCIGQAFAYDFEAKGIYYQYVGNSNANVAVVQNPNGKYSGDIVIPSSVRDSYGYTKSVTTIEEQAFKDCSGLTSIIIPNSVTNIKNEAFVGCSGLKTIKVAEDNAIYDSRENCNAIIETSSNILVAGCESTIIPNSVTEIGSYAFGGCSGLEFMVIPASVTRIWTSSFDGCSSLKLFVVNDGNPVYSAKEGVLMNLNQTKILLCPQGRIGAYTIPNSVTSIGDYAFYGCSGLTSISIPSSVTSIGNAIFAYCSGLTSVSIPNSVTSIGDHAFYGCSGQTSLTIPNSVKSIGKNAFYQCSGLKSVTIPSSIESIGDQAFAGCSNVENLNYDTDCIMPNVFGTKIKTLTIGNHVTRIVDEAFNGCKNLTSVNIGISVTSIGGSAFYGCSGLSSIIIPSSVTNIGEDAFRECSGLSSIIIPSSVTNIGEDAFRECSGLSSVIIPNSVTNIGGSAFYGCSGLSSVIIPNSVTNIGEDAFRECSGLSSVIIPNSITSIENRVFASCSGLTSVTIPNSVTNIGYAAFYGCSGLTSITIPNSVTSIGEEAFYGCTDLTSVTVFATTPPSFVKFYNHSEPFYYYSSGVTPRVLKVHVLKGYKSVYENSRWGKFTIIDDAEPTLVSSIEIDAPIYAVGLYESVTAKIVNILPEDAFNKAVTWSSAAPNVATINQSGQIVGLKEGVTTITATAVDGSGVTATALVKVGEASIIYINSIELAQSSYSLNVGESFTASVANILPSDASSKNVTWSSNDPTIVVINSSTGQALALKEGTTTIMATANDGSGVTATATVNVSTPEIFKGIKLNQLFGFSTPTRGAWTMDGTVLKGTGQSGVNQPVDVQNTNQQFALYMYEGQIYLWSQSAEHFLNNSGQAVPICNASPVAWSAEEGGTFFFHFTDAANKYINLGGGKQITIDSWKTSDEGNKMTLTPVEGFDIAVVQSVIDDDISPIITFVDGTAYTATTAKDCSEITYTRTFDNVWQALYVPFSLDYEEWCEDFDIAKIHNFIEYDDDGNGTIDRTYLVVVKKTSGSTEPNYPYLIRAKETGTKTLTLVNKTLEAAESTSIDCSSVKNRYTFTGTYTPVTDMYANGYYALSGGALNKANAAGVTLNPQRWYMEVTSRTSGSSTKAQSIRILVDGEEGIETPSNSPEGGEPVAYDLMGRMVSVKDNARGVNIVNGKKLIK